MAGQLPAREAVGHSTFYGRLEPFEDFAAVADARHYVEAPDDWLVVVADIKDSTEAARAGRYKDVNLIGAACITAVLNVTRGLELPFAFGGDGASLLIPSAARAAVASALIRTRRLAAEKFGLELRLGMVPVAEMRRRGRRVLVAKYALSPGNHLAMFAGGGLELADRLIKDGAGFGLDDEIEPGPADLNGLSCRWQPFRSLRGHMLTLLVRARRQADGLPLQQEIIEVLGHILGETPERAAPVQRANMRFVWPPAGLESEARLAGGRASSWRRAWLYFESLLQWLAERFDLRIGPYNAPVYRQELQRNSDYRKVADTLHMVLDCTDAQIGQIERYLEGLRAQGRIAYGLHRADRALMTCLVFSMEGSRHVHFVDGADGGYAMAALQLKAQLRAVAHHAGDGVADQAQDSEREDDASRKTCREAAGTLQGSNCMTKTDLSDIYRDYIACLNKQDWPKLGQFVDDDVCHNGRRIGLSGYREMLERDFHEIPDLRFDVQLLISDPPHIASRLGFDCTPKGSFLGLHVDGTKVSFTENVFYEFRDGRIAQVWSVIDKAAIEAQL